LQLFGQALSAWPGFFTHSPSRDQPGQLSCVSRHAPSHTPQLTGQCMFMKPGFSWHCPFLAQWLQFVWMSAQRGVHKPQLVGHSLCMNAVAVAHSPAFAHEAQVSFRSEQIMVHTPHDCGQRVFTCSPLVPSHSPSSAHEEHDVSLSLQNPIVASTPESVTRTKTATVHVALLLLENASGASAWGLTNS
jgi:hypothetical protein